MWNLLLKINRNLILAVPVAMLVGFAVGLGGSPTLLGALKGLIVPLTFLMVYPMMVALNISHLKEGINLRLQLVTQLLNFAVIPFLAYGLGLLFFPDRPYMALGLLLAALLPTSGMTISWTGFAKGNLGAAINMTVIGLTVGSLATPFYVKWLMGRTVNVDPALVMKQVLVIVFLPMLLGFITRRLFLKKFGPAEFKKTWAPRFPSLSTIGVLGIVAVAMALKAKTIAAQPAIIGYIFIPLMHHLPAQLHAQHPGGEDVLQAGRRHRPGLRHGDAQSLHRLGHRHHHLRGKRGRHRPGHRRRLHHPSPSRCLVRKIDRANLRSGAGRSLNKRESGGEENDVSEGLRPLEKTAK